MTENYFGHVGKTPEILPAKNKMSPADRVRQYGQNTQFRYVWARLEINFYQPNKSVNTLIHSDILISRWQPTREYQQHRQDTMNIKMFGGIHHLFTEAIFKPESSRQVPVSCVENTRQDLVPEL